eukprot:08377.XXX_309087_310839_1 [CDS] Oithona nana genome sequencing.
MEATELRKRTTVDADEVDSDTGPDTEVVSGKAVADAIGQDDNSKLEEALGSLPPRWKNWVIRGVFTWLMIGGFGLIIYGGPLALMLTTLCVQVKCFSEIINIGYAVYRVHNLPWFRSLSWYFLVTSNYFFYGESLMDYFGVLINRIEVLPFLIRYHRFISFTMYVMGFVWFVLSLVKKYYMRQFSLFAWTHVALLIVVTQSYLIIQNMFEGLIWFIMPIMMVVINDVMAYMFGFSFGKTPLIQLSPKKTWEGFIGGGISTVMITLVLSHYLCQYSSLVCPIEFNEALGKMTHSGCEFSFNFLPQEFELPATLATIRRMMKMKETITLYPFLLHAFFMSIFASVIGPFGGFFASGFKRAFKIKDFGDIIPGHGGIMDRFDCQFLMATFVNVYIHSFIRMASPQKLLQQFYMMKPEEQLQMYYSIQDSLSQRGILQH